MNYLKERNKMIVLLVVGVVLMVTILYLLSLSGNGIYIVSFSGLFVVCAIICYPIAIVYGHRQIIDIFHSIRMGARQPFQAETPNSLLKPLFVVLNTVIAFLTVVVFGWVYGAYMAYQKLRMMKAFRVK